jgi:hypothetical protein
MSPRAEQLLKIATDALLTKLPTDNVIAMPAPVEMPLAA